MNEPTTHESQRSEDSANATRRSASFSNLTSVIALAVSIFALAIGAWQTRLMQRQAHAGVWPYLAQGYTYTNNTDRDSYVVTVDNNGVGPARVESVVVAVDGRPMKRWKDVMTALGVDDNINFATTSLNGDVIPPSLNRETTIAAVRIHDSNAAAIFRHATERIAIDICYCSVYDDCWISHWQQTKVESVARCRDEGIQFQE